MMVYGVQAKNHSDMVVSATFASLISMALLLSASLFRKEATFIFFACSRMAFSWAATA